ncbi:MAG: SAM-dependent methyltransferase [Solirubrobacteraceae bacterium]|jgi:predicted TPR repeat methyltransferase
MSHLSPADFEERYRADPDPWSYASSGYERAKYGATLAACGPGPFARALELGASIGVFSELLAPRCRSLTTVDAAPTAVAAARRRLAGREAVTVVLGELPDAIPQAGYDLVVASEILYYVEATALRRTLAVLRERMVAGARLVAVHWRPPGPERPFDAAAVHALLHRQGWLSADRCAHTDDYLLDVLER